MITPTTTYMTVFIAPPNVVCPCFDRPSSLLLTLHASGAEVVDARLAAVVRDARRKEFQAFVASQLFRRRHGDERVPLFAARGALRERPFVRVRRGIRLPCHTFSHPCLSMQSHLVFHEYHRGFSDILHYLLPCLPRIALGSPPLSADKEHARAHMVSLFRGLVYEGAYLVDLGPGLVSSVRGCLWGVRVGRDVGS